ncbi:hypothetical protein RhiirA5_359966 [Rhizophagus irregularis]|uniref:Uncharacterized protein n=2 Tax=Rhizophagus irregularis TaxID=588596 RepID=U9SN47_RHIID|nr:hypothetical protein GLOIN_2v1561966 [Rhizophagus irregularis DAOM 181602=DAOM 197198]PKC06703.1 hypothetical protein RhiirA5_359966 [Rhizophagus irregularis]PKC55066.1 hypothetical protein RhiirA1_429678 [Rhizophagus irregularis]PKY32519.1 hypothetical protein RhiirB3_420193 [Rhizophagus irregularis]POG75739.1 hypothetical protein GLOIN_2v1561966 [Rhizophagus irregularis DAOM 181602=DAOM 197198]UZO29137.1 hypothetical protein OCT59_022626 [Rhizophagus irregularis]|eukprot:XP_025182605.1 hypothetical protein GLOIN_2v1561966 [Rhizophagus irregularis DAOM 181602=DAOM 197198]
MASKIDFGIRGAIQNEPNNRTSRPGGKKNYFRQFPSNIDYHHLGRLVFSLDLRISTHNEDEIKRTNRLFDGKSETLSRKFDNNSTERTIETINCERNVLSRNFETRRNSCEIYDGCIDSLQTINEQKTSGVKDEANGNVTMGKECEGCSNRRTMGELQARFGKLFRIGSLGDNAWKSTIPPRTCRLIHAQSRYTQGGSSSIECHTTVHQVQLCDGNDESSSGCNNTLVLVDAFEDKSRVATSCKFKIFDSDPKELTYYIKCIAEFGFNHIIIVGETNGGMVFLDCYGRVFLWNDESLSLWPLGDSPEEASKYTIKGKDRLEWFVENGIVYEIIEKWQDIY